MTTSLIINYALFMVLGGVLIGFIIAVFFFWHHW